MQNIISGKKENTLLISACRLLLFSNFCRTTLIPHAPLEIKIISYQIGNVWCVRKERKSWCTKRKSGRSFTHKASAHPLSLIFLSYKKILLYPNLRYFYSILNQIQIKKIWKKKEFQIRWGANPLSRVQEKKDEKNNAPFPFLA